jgi:phosphoribosylformylglycinamidine synthase
MRARVFVTLKPSVFDPQGKTIADALHSLGYSAVEDVRQGKYFEIELGDGLTPEAARAEDFIDLGDDEPFGVAEEEKAVPSAEGGHANAPRAA